MTIWIKNIDPKNEFCGCKLRCKNGYVLISDCILISVYSGTSVYVHLGLRLFRFTYGDLSKMLPRFTYKNWVYVHSFENLGLQQVGETSEGV